MPRVRVNCSFYKSGYRPQAGGTLISTDHSRGVRSDRAVHLVARPGAPVHRKSLALFHPWHRLAPASLLASSLLISPPIVPWRLKAVTIASSGRITEQSVLVHAVSGPGAGSSPASRCSTTGRTLMTLRTPVFGFHNVPTALFDSIRTTVKRQEEALHRFATAAKEEFTLIRAHHQALAAELETSRRLVGEIQTSLTAMTAVLRS